MVVPRLAGHLYGHQQAGQADRAGHQRAGFLPLARQGVRQSRHAHADPDGEGVERAGVGIVAFTRLHRRLVEVEHDGDARHEEQEEYHPELLDALLSAVGLPKQADEAQQQGQAVEDVAPLVLLQLRGQVGLVAYQPVVYEGDARDPVAMLYLAVALDVVLATSEVPQEVAPVHPVELVGEEELDVLPLRGHVHRHHLAAAVIGHLMTLDVHPVLIVIRVRAAVHAGEEHVLRVGVFHASGDFHVAVLLVGRCFLLADKLGRLAGDARFAIAVVGGVEGHLRGVGLSVEQRACAILFASQVFAQREDVLRRVLIHRRVRCGADDDERVGRIAHHDEQRTEQGGVQRAGADAVFFLQRGLRPGAQVEPEQGDDD